jgi:isoleucyl-tRNA synthetase
MVWNMYDFFTLYADVDGWEWSGSLDDPSASVVSPLDQWIISRTHQLIEEVGAYLDAYNFQDAIKPILPFIDDASNWYVRRSRRRFWKSDSDADKQDAYKTLHYVLVQLAHVLAPFTPFLAEELYIKLTGGESVHLRDWPTAGKVNASIIEQMAETRLVIEHGLALRMFKSDDQAQVKVRQPLNSLSYRAPAERLNEELEAIIAEEVNVKKVEFSGQDSTVQVSIDKQITPELRREGMVREVIRNVQSARKQADLNVDDHIQLSLSTTNEELRRAIEEHHELIATETLADKVVFDQTFTHDTACSVESAQLTVSLKKK